MQNRVSTKSKYGFFKKENLGCCLRLKFRIFYNRLLVWIEFKFVEILNLKNFDNRFLDWIEFKFVEV